MQSSYDIESIKTGLGECLDIANAHSSLSLAEVIKNSIEKLSEPMQLAIIGKISSSKSTLINAILGKEELMSTGQKEVTYNVGWLKYGSPDSDIVIHYKDGSEPARKSKKEFQRYSVDTTHEDIDRISYIETFDDSELLKDINIIDTPGLDAKREKDSQNTLDFISKVRPDAVVMLFTHAVSENVLDVVKQFNAGTSFNPLNAIGVLSKIDVLWQETIPHDKSALAIGSRMVSSKKRNNPILFKTLFDMYPISALVYLAATTVGEEDIALVKKACDNDCTAFIKSLNSMPKFLSEPSTPFDQKIRQKLANKIGLYGIHLLANRLKNNEDVSLPAVKEMFLRESGAVEFRKTLYNHFGSRAKLIKLESIYQHISQELKRARGVAKSSEEAGMIATIEQKISEIFSSLVHEHKEYNMLLNIYDGKLSLDGSVVCEFKNLCGENGNSAPQKLGLPTGTDLDTLLERAVTKEKEWRREVALEPDPVEREWMKVMLKSYTNLRHKIATMKYQYEQASCFLFNR